MATIKELKQNAKELNIKNYSRMNKETLQKEISKKLAVIPSNKDGERKFKNWVKAMSVTAIMCLIMGTVAVAYWYYVLREETVWEQLLSMIGM